MNEKEFDRLFDLYEVDCCFYSFVQRDHKSYRQIKEMGQEAIPLLLKNINRGWLAHCLLSDITGESPWIPDDVGYFDKISKAWISWGEVNGFLSSVTT